MMTCFEWRNHAGEFLDGRLPPGDAERAARHLADCEECEVRHRRLRTLVDAIRAQPRSPLPAGLRQAPLSAPAPRLDLSGGRSRWQALPWYLRTSLEGLAVASAVLLVVALVPRLRSLYDASVDRKLEAVLMTEPGLPASAGAPVPLARGRRQTVDADAGEDFSAGDEEDDPSAAPESDAEGADFESAESGAPAEGSSDLRVGNSEIWRFHLKSDSPREFRGRIVEVLTQAGVPPQTPGFGGVEAPGGIQFDLLVTKDLVGPLKSALEKIALPSAETSDNPASVRARPFTWYKNRSRRQLPGGRARVVIWLSQY